MATRAEIPTMIALMMSGVLPGSSATYGAIIVIDLDKQLQMPKTVDANKVGISCTFAMKHILKQAAQPNLANGIKTINMSSWF